MANAEQQARAIVYRDAAAEHVLAAAELYDDGRYVLAAYVAGLSVECILRGYRIMIDPEFDSRHELTRLYELAKFGDIVPSSHSEKITVLLGQVVQLWSNEYRFFSADALRKRWVRQKLFERVKGDFVKERTRQLVNAASEIVAIGVARWKTSSGD
jgi:hypothetical protein